MRLVFLKKAIVTIVAVVLWIPCLQGGDYTDELALDQLLDLSDLSQTEIEQYLEEWFENPLDWKTCKVTDIDFLPLNERLKEKLVYIKKEKIKLKDWHDLERLYGFSTEEAEVVRRFFIMPADIPLAEVSVQNFVSLTADPRIDLNKNLQRCRVSNKRGWIIGIVSERDAGEKSVWDYYNFTFRAPQLLENLDIGGGAYRFNWGQGLIFASQVSMGKGTGVASNILSREPRFGEYLSTDENRYLSGLNLKYRLGRFTLCSFGSRRMLDASLDDSLVVALRSTGIHVTDSEIKGKDRLRELTGGIGGYYTTPHLEVGLMAFQSRYNYPVQLYAGSAVVGGYSLYQKFSWSDGALAGEAAVLNSREYAFIEGYYLKFGDVKLGLQLRYFSDYFQTPLGSVMKEYSSLANERGLYIGSQVKVLQQYWLSTAIDFYRKNRSFEAGVDPPRGSEAQLAIQRHWQNQHFLEVRYKRELILQSNIGLTRRRQMSFSSRYGCSEHCRLLLRGTMVEIQEEASQANGSALSVYLDYRTGSGIKLTGGTTHFYTSDSRARIYLYEPGTPLRFGMVLLTGTGWRWFLTFQKVFRDVFELSLTSKIQFRKKLEDSDFTRSQIFEIQLMVDL
jgi:hypothetical protein